MLCCRSRGVKPEAATEWSQDIRNEQGSKMGLRRQGLRNQACLLCLLGAGLLHCCAGQASSSQASCNVAGFTFKPKQVPTRASLREGLDNIPVKLLSLPYKAHQGYYQGPRPFADLSSTAAACSADAACGMFTSDGYIIGAYRTDSWPGSRENTTEADVVGWQPMDYCSWACCGTWVADGFLAQLARPVPTALRAAAAGSSVVRVNISDLPDDSVGNYILRSDLLQTVCVGKPNTFLGSLDGGKVSPPGTPDCPQRCLVACCKLATASRPGSSLGNYMGRFHFSQCSGTACLHCGYADIQVAANIVGTALLRAYKREQSLSAAGTPASAQTSGKVSCIHGSTAVAKAGEGSLC